MLLAESGSLIQDGVTKQITVLSALLKKKPINTLKDKIQRVIWGNPP
jgi:hypothetical protein